MTDKPELTCIDPEHFIAEKSNNVILSKDNQYVIEIVKLLWKIYLKNN